MLEFEASAPVTALIEVTDGEHKWQLEYGPEHDPSAGLPVVGMRPDRRHEIRVAIRLAAGAEVSSPTVLEFQAPALPEAGVDFPPIEVAVSKPGEMEPGVTLFNPRRRRVGRGQDVAEFKRCLRLGHSRFPATSFDDSRSRRAVGTLQLILFLVMPLDLLHVCFRRRWPVMAALA